jgi:flagellar hook-associated protein 1 FlgK
MLRTSLTGMIAFQRALEMTGHNISNANTPGYNRQVADFSSRAGQGQGNIYIGGGTQISSIKRVYDVMLGEQLRTSTTGQARFDIMNTMSGRIDSLLADPDTGLNTGLQSFFNSMQDLTNDPASIPVRQALIGESQGIAQRFQLLQHRLGEIDSEVNQRISQSVTDINRIASEIGSVNDKITLAVGGSDAQPNDLLDHRDSLVRQLAGQISVTTTMQDDGAMNVFIGSGQALVMGANAQSLVAAGSEFDPTRLVVGYEGSTGNTPLDTGLTGGTLGGLLDYRSQILDPARESLGQTAVAFVSGINGQHAAGMDLRGNLGGDLFAIDPPRILYSSNNGGNGTASADVVDVGALTGAQYVLEFDGAAYSLRRADTGQPITMTGTGTPADPFVADGMNIEVAGAPAAGDRVLIRSASDASGSIRSLISDPQALALAAPTRSLAANANVGDGSIAPAVVVDEADPALLGTSVIEFIDSTTYMINGAGAFAYTDGSPIVVNGSSVAISGVPMGGDQFTIEPNYGASGDNSNGLLLTGMQSIGLLDNGTISINDNYGRLVADVGGASRQVQASLDAQNVVLANAENAYTAKSAVNLDEEAANLIKYQQAYQAMAQVVGVVSTLFDSLLSATRR